MEVCYFIDDLNEAISFPSFDLQPSLYPRMVSSIILTDGSVFLSNLRIRLSTCFAHRLQTKQKKNRLDISLKLLNF